VLQAITKVAAVIRSVEMLEYLDPNTLLISGLMGFLLSKKCSASWRQRDLAGCEGWFAGRREAGS
jgi:hypothetical protein